MADQVSEQLQCPICFELPVGEIFQCINGHTICAGCSKDLTICPQCRVNYGPQKIRNRALESILDEMKFDCSNAQFGCPKKVPRKLLSTHVGECQFRDVSFPLCKIIGYNCEFKSSPRFSEHIVHHLTRTHGAKVKASSSGVLIMDNFSHVAYNKTSIWTPVIFKIDKFHYLVFPKINGAQQSLSISCISLNSTSPQSNVCDLKFRLNGNDNEILPIDCTVKSSILKTADDTINYPMLQLPALRLQLKYTQADNLYIEVSLQSPSFPVGTMKGGPAERILMQNDPLTKFRPGEAVRRIASKNYVSAGVTCNKCDKNPIIGIRFSCLQCENFNLCEICRRKGEHGFHFFTAIRNDMERAAFSKLKYEKGVEKWKPLMSADFTIGSDPMNCCECLRQEVDKKAVMICKECPDLYGVCTNCYLNNCVRNGCKEHDIMQAGTSEMA